MKFWKQWTFFKKFVGDGGCSLHFESSLVGMGHAGAIYTGRRTLKRHHKHRDLPILGLLTLRDFHGSMPSWYRIVSVHVHCNSHQLTIRGRFVGNFGTLRRKPTDNQTARDAVGPRKGHFYQVFGCRHSRCWAHWIRWRWPRPWNTVCGLEEELLLRTHLHLIQS